MTPAAAITTYIAAKDGNRPVLLEQAFAPDVRLFMNVKSDAVSFPGSATGLGAVSDVLVRDFATKYENVYTFCLAKPASNAAQSFSCSWLVGMSTKTDNSVRVGCGTYDWRFDASGKVEELAIQIEKMEILAPDTRSVVMSWLAAMDYPWCTSKDVLDGMPHLDALKAVRDYLVRR